MVSTRGQIIAHEEASLPDPQPAVTPIKASQEAPRSQVNFLSSGYKINDTFFNLTVNITTINTHIISTYYYRQRCLQHQIMKMIESGQKSIEQCSGKNEKQQIEICLVEYTIE